MFWVELILVLAIIFLGVRKGGTFLAMAGGVQQCRHVGDWISWFA